MTIAAAATPSGADVRLVEEDLLGETGGGRAEAEVVREPGARGLVAGPDRPVADEQLRVRAHDREAEVAVVQDRERRGPEALVRHAVLEDQARGAEPRHDPALEAQVLAEEARLPRLALDLEHVLVAAPLLAHAQVLGGEVRGPAVQAVALALGIGRPEVVEAAGRDEPAAEGAQPTEAAGLVERGRTERGVRPREGPAGVLGRPEVEPPIEEHLETEARAGEHLGRPHPTHTAVGEVHEPDAGQLGHPSDQPAQLPPSRTIGRRCWACNPLCHRMIADPRERNVAGGLAPSGNISIRAGFVLRLRPAVVRGSGRGIPYADTGDRPRDREADTFTPYEEDFRSCRSRRRCPSLRRLRQGAHRGPERSNVCPRRGEDRRGRRLRSGRPGRGRDRFGRSRRPS